MSQVRETRHGEVASWPLSWGPPGVLPCDWGGCERVAVAARFDAWGHGWLPVCAECAIKPDSLEALDSILGELGLETIH
jgi:hypothetical protein